MKIYIVASSFAGDNLAKVGKELAASKIDYYKQDYSGDIDEKWQLAYDHIGSSDYVLINAGGRQTEESLIEQGIAYGARKPILLAVRQGDKVAAYKDIAYATFDYKDTKDLIKQLDALDTEKSFNDTDRLLWLTIVACGILAASYVSARVFLPLSVVVAFVLWYGLTRASETIRRYERALIYVPLAVLWLVIAAELSRVDYLVATGWTLVYWVATVVILKKLKFSL